MVSIFFISEPFSPYENGQCTVANDITTTENMQVYEPPLREHLTIQQPSTSSSLLWNDHPIEVAHRESVSTSMRIHTNNINSASVTRTQSGTLRVDNNSIINNRDFLTNSLECITDEISLQNQQSQQSQNSVYFNLVSVFPCLHPINPYMRSFEARLQTFFENIVTWNSSSELHATPEDLATAGLFCLGM